MKPDGASAKLLRGGHLRWTIGIARLWRDQGLISENRKANEVVVKLRPSAVELVAKRCPALA